MRGASLIWGDGQIATEDGQIAGRDGQIYPSIAGRGCQIAERLPQCPQTATKKESGEARDTGTNPKVVRLRKLFLFTV
jgi:hypothetical protein